MTNQKPSHRQQYVRSTIIGFGFLSGLWIHLGFNPQTFVYNFLQSLLVAAQPQYSQAITSLFYALPIFTMFLAIWGAYRKAGILGLIAVGMAFIAGVWLTLISVPLLIGAEVIGWLAARR